MGSKKPLRRHEALKPLSRQHHFGLLFSWKLRKGFAESISIDRLKAFADWFFIHETQPHFKIEEEYIFPILGTGHALIIRALKEHRRIERLFRDIENPKNSLSLLEEELEAHIRFEERLLFTEIQKAATKEELREIEKIHFGTGSKEDYPDPFWGKN
ncbi:hemerythrin domain-containing protein [Autumnicola musiva]|uniref:Hemerythrin domain-containing protein n=1 Tax=Autumnicola musiva TaxID=3075589 RepID=A0ABU3DA99_9FLAO|nr:hemerythrin domain-containing protein [Zunongwangia sp. F117]MDT0678467.1 hemerythrin domain-containing protein [Zunongwangia sp. F117]